MLGSSGIRVSELCLGTMMFGGATAEAEEGSVRAGSKEAKLWLHDLTVAFNIRFRAHELNAIIRYLRSHRDELLEAWDDHFGN